MKKVLRLLMVLGALTISLGGCIPYEKAAEMNSNSGSYGMYGAQEPKTSVDSIYIAEGKWYLGKIGSKEADYKINNIYDSAGNGGYLIDFTLESTGERKILTISTEENGRVDYKLNNTKIKETFTGDYLEDINNLSDTTYFKVSKYNLNDIKNFEKAEEGDWRKVGNNLIVKSQNEVYLYPYNEAVESESVSSTESVEENNQ